MSKTKTTKIKSILEKRNNANAVHLKMINRQKRLIRLVDAHGMADVALAAGYTESTLQQYIRIKNPSAIGEEAVAQAESIFRQIG